MSFPPKNYTIGRYRVYFDKFVDGTRVSAGGQRYFGNTPELNMSSESETLDHFDADNGIRIKDDSVLLELTRTGSFVTDHISPDNLALFFLGDASTVVQSAATAQVYNINDIQRDRRYQLGASPSAPSGVRGITSAVVTSSPIGVTYAPGADYRVDLTNGGLIIPATSTIPVNADIIVTYNVTATSYNRVVTADGAQIYGALFLESNNPKGEKMDYFIPYASVTPDGDFALKADEWQQLPFSFEILKLDDQTPAVFINGRPGSGV
ncbi:MAG: hypothetical protein DDT26_00293 [Dehalococcoidia bacterium]|nr:hypothetical protein [Chloroflexota bacterium]